MERALREDKTAGVINLFQGPINRRNWNSVLGRWLPLNLKIHCKSLLISCLCHQEMLFWRLDLWTWTREHLKAKPLGWWYSQKFKKFWQRLQTLVNATNLSFCSNLFFRQPCIRALFSLFFSFLFFSSSVRTLVTIVVHEVSAQAFAVHDSRKIQVSMAPVQFDTQSCRIKNKCKLFADGIYLKPPGYVYWDNLLLLTAHYSRHYLIVLSNVLPTLSIMWTLVVLVCYIRWSIANKANE